MAEPTSQQKIIDNSSKLRFAKWNNTGNFPSHAQYLNRPKLNGKP